MTAGHKAWSTQKHVCSVQGCSIISGSHCSHHFINLQNDVRDVIHLNYWRGPGSLDHIAQRSSKWAELPQRKAFVCTDILLHKKISDTLNTSTLLTSIPSGHPDLYCTSPGELIPLLPTCHCSYWAPISFGWPNWPCLASRGKNFILQPLKVIWAMWFTNYWTD